VTNQDDYRHLERLSCKFCRKPNTKTGRPGG